MNRRELLAQLKNPAARAAVEAQLSPLKAKRPKGGNVATVAKSECSMGAVSVWIPIRLISEANARQHHFAKARRVKSQRQAVQLILGPMKRFLPELPVRVKIVRYGPKTMDVDNNVGSIKHVQDQIAEIIGVDDGSDLVTWEYGQMIDKTYRVWVHITGNVATP